MRVGSAEVDAVRLGGQEVSKIMLGSQEAWSSAPKPVDDIFGDGSAVYLWRFENSLADNIAGQLLTPVYPPVYMERMPNNFALGVQWDNGLSCPVPSNVSPVSGYTISFWVTALVDPDYSCLSLNIYNATFTAGYPDTNLVFIFDIAHPSLYMDMSHSSTPCHWSYTTAVNTSQWHHVCYTVDANGMRAFLDGVFIHELLPCETLVDISDAYFYIFGSYIDTSYIDTLRVFNRKITDAEALILYEEQF